ncbi:hypothetical protein GGR51DRAFT_560388 [Nemania sp. FL0031]|nr:hypothetical protein GGR51DRAFT_560388 [Nemania sp. FL0031]
MLSASKALDLSPEAEQPSTSPPSQLTSPNHGFLTELHRLQTGNPIADIILVGDLYKSGRKIWEQDKFFWPEQIPQVDIYEFSYSTDDVARPETRENAVKALKDSLSPRVLRGRSTELKNAASDQNWSGVKRRAQYVILVGYGYGGLLCEQVITLTKQSAPACNVIKGLVLFGTPNFARGLQQWARIVLEATTQPKIANKGSRAVMRARWFPLSLAPPPITGPPMSDLETEFKSISSVQRDFFNQTRDPWWCARIASCFPESSPSSPDHKPTIFPEWCTVPHGFPIDVGKPYQKMTAFNRDEAPKYQVITNLITEWIAEIGNKGKAPSIEGVHPRGKNMEWRLQELRIFWVGPKPFG